MPIIVTDFTKDTGNYASNPALLPSQSSPTVTITDPALAAAMNATKDPNAIATDTTGSVADNEASTFNFILGWTLLILILFFVNKTRLGHVIIYYSLLLIILLILLTEYQQIVPILNSVQTIGAFNQKNAA